MNALSALLRAAREFELAAGVTVEFRLLALLVAFLLPFSENERPREIRQSIKAILSVRFIFPSLVLGSFAGNTSGRSHGINRTLHFHGDLLWLSQTTSESIWARMNSREIGLSLCKDECDQPRRCVPILF